MDRSDIALIRNNSSPSYYPMGFWRILSLLAGLCMTFFVTCAQAEYAVEIEVSGLAMEQATEPSADKSTAESTDDSPPLTSSQLRDQLHDRLVDLLRDHLDLMRYRKREDISADQLNFMIARAPNQVTKLFATEGYFSPETTVHFDQDAQPPLVKLTVRPGARTHVKQVELEITGAVRTESPAQANRIRRSWRLDEERPFRQEDWANAKERGLRQLQEQRYAAARIARSEASIHPEREAAELSVTYDSGPKFTLGPLAVTGTQRYPDSIIHNVNPLQTGDDYSVERLLVLQRAIQRTPYFSNVTVSIDPDPEHAELAPVKVNVSEFRTQRIRAGVGYTTDTGARMEGRYSHFNVFDRAWVFDAQTRQAQKKQTTFVELAMPPAPGAYVNSAFGSFERTTLEGVDLRSRSIGVQRARSTDNFDYAVSVKYYQDSLEQLSGAPLPSGTVIEPGTHKALVFGGSMTRRNVDNLQFPRRGTVMTLEAGVALETLLTDQSFVRLHGKLRHYYPIDRRNLLVLRAELGAVLTKDGGNTSIPASLLFRAGGTESVRGYAFESIGNPRNGTVFPTRYVATGGIEYQRWFNATWGGAVFYDVGTANDDWSGYRLYQAVGVGARYRSPVGPVNFDLGYGIRDQKVRPHLSLGMVF